MSRLAANLGAAGIDPAAVSVDSLLSPLPQAGGAALAEGALRIALGNTIQSVFLIAFAAAAVGLLVTACAPNRQLRGQELATARRPVETAIQGD